MPKLILGFIIILVGLAIVALASARSAEGRPGLGIGRFAGFGLLGIGALFMLGSAIVVIDAGQVGVRHAFGQVDQTPLMPGMRFVTPWSRVERFSTREEQFPGTFEDAENIAALSSEQMGMTIDVALRWQIDPMAAPLIYTEIGGEEQIHTAVRNAIRNGVRDGMVGFSINDISRRNAIAATMEAEVDSALTTRPRAGGGAFRIASVTAFFLHDLQPPQQVVQAINDKIAQEQQIQTERHRVEVARLQAEQQRLLNQTLTAEALTKQYLEVLHELRNSSNMIILVPTEGGLPVLNVGDLRRNLQQQR